MSQLQDNALNLLGNAASFISTQLSSGSVDSDLIESIGTSLFSGIGNVLDAASSEAQTDTEDVERDEIKPKSSNEAEKVAMKEKVRGKFTLLKILHSLFYDKFSLLKGWQSYKRTFILSINILTSLNDHATKL